MKTLSWIVPAALLAACNGDNGDGTAPGDLCDESGNICTWLGFPEVGGVSAEGLQRTAPTAVKSTWLFLPVDIDFASDGTAYYPDYNNHRIRRVNLDGTVDTLSGTTQLGDGPNDQGSVTNCWGGCDAMNSAWNHPTHAVVNPANEGEIWVAAWHNSRINIIDPTANTLTWYAGSGGRQYSAPIVDDTNSDGFSDGDVNQNGSILDEATMDLPSAIAFADDGTIYFADQANHLIRRITTDGLIENVAGQPRHAGHSGDGGPASAAELHGHTDQKADPGSKLEIDGHMLYFTDTVNGVIRSIDLDTMTIDHVAGKYETLGTGDIVDGATGAIYQGDLGSVPGYADGSADQAVFNTPRDLAVGLDGEIYVAEPNNNCVRVITPEGQVETFAGACGADGAYAGDEGPATEASLFEPYGVAVDPDGNVYIADTKNQIIRRVAR